MKIEIDYNGAFAICRIEPMDEPGKMVNFNDADTKSQTYALSAFRTVEEHWRREKQLERYKNLPVAHYKREIQVTVANFMKLQELMNDGVIQTLNFSTMGPPNIKLLLNDGHTKVQDNGWLMQDNEGRWWGMDAGYHRMLQEYGKIVIEP